MMALGRFIAVLAIATAAVSWQGLGFAEDPPAEGPVEDSAAATDPVGPVMVARVSHVNSGLVFFDEYDRRYVPPDGHYVSETGVKLQIDESRITRMVGCGAEPCDLTAHSTRIVGRQLLLWVEVAVPDGTYRHDGGASIEIQGGEVVKYVGPGEEN